MQVVFIKSVNMKITIKCFSIFQNFFLAKSIKLDKIMFSSVLDGRNSMGGKNTELQRGIWFYFPFNMYINCRLALCLHAFFISNTFFFNSASWLLKTFSWIELQMLLRCCLIHKNVILREFLYLLYLSPCIFLGLFLSYLCDLFFIFILIFMMITRLIS